MNIDVKDPKNWISRDIFESYCGAGSDKLMSCYDKAVEKKNLVVISLNWLAILILPAWLGYRKQWTILIIVILLIAASTFVEAIFDITLPNSSFLGGFIFAGLMSNSFLLTKANNKFMKLKKSGMSEEEIKIALQDKASGSVSMAIAGTVLSFIVLFVLAVIADVCFGLPE